MNETVQRIGLLYSYGPHFMKTLRALRDSHPDAQITVFVPANFPEALLDGMALHIRPILPDSGQRPGIRQGLRLIRAIRGEALDSFVVLFASPRLQLVASLSKAVQSYCYHVDGRVEILRLRLLRALLRPIKNRIIGNLRYFRIWVYVHCTRVNAKRPQEKLSDADPNDDRTTDIRRD